MKAEECVTLSMVEYVRIVSFCYITLDKEIYGKKGMSQLCLPTNVHIAIGYRNVYWLQTCIFCGCKWCH